MSIIISNLQFQDNNDDEYATFTRVWFVTAVLQSVGLLTYSILTFIAFSQTTRGPGINQLNTAVRWIMRVSIRKEGTRGDQWLSCAASRYGSFWRGDQIFPPGRRRRRPGSFPPDNHNLFKVGISPRGILGTFPLKTPTTEIFTTDGNMTSLKNTQEVTIETFLYPTQFWL